MKRSIKSKSGQTMVEYIIIVVVIAVAALAVFGIFGDTIKAKLSGAVSELDSGEYADAAQSEAGEVGESEQNLKDLDKEGGN